MYAPVGLPSDQDVCMDSHDLSQSAQTYYGLPHECLYLQLKVLNNPTTKVQSQVFKLGKWHLVICVFRVLSTRLE